MTDWTERQYANHGGTAWVFLELDEAEGKLTDAVQKLRRAEAERGHYAQQHEDDEQVIIELRNEVARLRGHWNKRIKTTSTMAAWSSWSRG